MKLRRTALAVLATGSIFLSGCANSGTPAANNSSAASASHEPIVVENCGQTIKLDAPAQRIATTEQGATETILSLGGHDQLVGVAQPKDLYWERNANLAKDLKVFNQAPPTTELIRDVDAQLVVSPFGRVFTKDKVGLREEYAQVGVGAWFSNMECAPADEDGYISLERDFEQLGKLIGREAEAQKLIDDQRKAISKATATGKGQSTVYLYSVYDDAPYVAGGDKLTTNIAKITNTKNVFQHLSGDWPQISWEAFADADPDLIYLVDLPTRGHPGDTAKEKIEILKSNPATRNMRAVREDKFISVPGVGLSASSRSIEPLQVIGAELAKF
ncbi:ABC transporter substrate-binding protein [Corynebacterium caspium]|uniref:ABC transporter substrate-binding protein n=1 Tax=Corynebacterium caspium TaxID=234828 RepID=UPI00037F6F75|nr:ABC transporter substrate-binding protein [Corynebacterium caspium]WKD58463.1 corrinoid ABC transporter substrate-binding protein [Corynebacterium caspium DSM 44850]